MMSRIAVVLLNCNRMSLSYNMPSLMVIPRQIPPNGQYNIYNLLTALIFHRIVWKLRYHDCRAPRPQLSLCRDQRPWWSKACFFLSIKCHISSDSISFIFTESDCLDNFTLFDYTHIYLIWPNIFKYVEGNFTRIVQEDAHCLFGGNCVICSAIPWTYYSWRSLLCSMSRVKSAQ